MSDRSRKDLLIGVSAAEAGAQAPSPTIWQNYRWAPDWYEDARNEVGLEGRSARRREILFSATLAESYLFEWAMTQVLASAPSKNPFGDIFDYLPAKDRRGLPDRWKDTAKRMTQEGLVQSSPDFGQEDWKDFLRLFEMRNGLVHALASRPTSRSARDLPKPVPTAEELEALEPGWSLSVVVKQIDALHDASGIPKPDWLP